jgi:4'-phosphopantetheinyl transferase
LNPTLKEQRGLTEVVSESVDVWCTNLDMVATSRGAELGVLLSKEECDRGNLLRDADSRRRYVAGREMLRLILGEQCGMDPADVSFDYGPQGKPSMKGSRSTFFSTAHSDGLSAVAVTRLGEVGIDIERLRPDVDVDRIAIRMFPPEDLGQWAALPDGDRVSAFFDGWVRREALVKATGIGLLHWWRSRAGLRTNPAGSRTDIDRDEARGWQVCVFSPSSDAIGCVAVYTQHPINVRLRSLQEPA